MEIQANQNQVIDIAAIGGGKLRFMACEGRETISISCVKDGWVDAVWISVEDANRAISRMLASGGKVVSQQTS